MFMRAAILCGGGSQRLKCSTSPALRALGFTRINCYNSKLNRRNQPLIGVIDESRRSPLRSSTRAVSSICDPSRGRAFSACAASGIRRDRNAIDRSIRPRRFLVGHRTSDDCLSRLAPAGGRWRQRKTPPPAAARIIACCKAMLLGRVRVTR
jgi:hypothetical protein